MTAGQAIINETMKQYTAWKITELIVCKNVGCIFIDPGSSSVYRESTPVDRTVLTLSGTSSYRTPSQAIAGNTPWGTNRKNRQSCQLKRP